MLLPLEIQKVILFGVDSSFKAGHWQIVTIPSGVVRSLFFYGGQFSKRYDHSATRRKKTWTRRFGC